MSKITYEDIEEKVYELEEFDIQDSDEPMLSLPMLMFKGEMLFCVFMVYEYYYEGIPSYYVVTPLPELSPQIMKAPEAMEFLGMPDEVLFGKDDDRAFPGSRDDLYDLFDECLSKEEFSKEAYNRYLDAVIECAKATAVRFYEFFRMR